MKELSTLLIAITAIASSSSAQNTWTQMADFEGGGRYGAVSFSIGNKGYLGTGNLGFLANDFWEYDPTLNSWTQKADFSGSARESAVGFSIGNKGYIGTGYAGSFAKDFWEYDPTLNSWTQKADFTGEARIEAVGFSIGNKGYVGTGADDNQNYLNDFWEYDPNLDTWAQKSDFFHGRAAAVGFSIGNKGYVGTGYNAGGLKEAFFEYDPLLDSWKPKADFAGGLRKYAVGFAIGSYGYILTGYKYDNGYIQYDDLWAYNSASNSWTQKTIFAGDVRHHATAFSIGDRGYIGTGVSGYISNDSRNDFWEYTPDIVGVSSIDKDECSLSFSPNPAEDHFTIAMSTRASENTSVVITITDVLGKQMLQQESFITQGKLSDEILLNEQFTSGLYLIRINVDDAVYTAPLIVQR